MQKTVTWILAVAALAIAATLAWMAWQGMRRHAPPPLTTPYQAVLLANGQAFFGRIENIGSDYPVLREVYYIQSRINPETKQSTNVLVRRGQEWHAPDHMILDRRQVVLIEPVTEGSQVAKLIAEQRRN